MGIAAVVVALTAMGLSAGPAKADAHNVGAGEGDGTAVVTPGPSRAVGLQTTELSVDGIGVAFYLTEISASVTWDCDFRLTSAVVGTLAADGGLSEGTCTGDTPEFGDNTVVVTCPFYPSVYARVGTVVQVAGVCWAQWFRGFGNFVNFTMTAPLVPHSVPFSRPNLDRLLPRSPSTTFDVAAATFQYRG